MDNKSATYACDICEMHHPKGFGGNCQDNLYRLTAAQAERLDAARLYDNGGKTADRYTCVFMDNATGLTKGPRGTRNCFEALGFSADPFYPTGVGLHTDAVPGNHLGRRIRFVDLPAKAAKFVKQNLTEEPDA